MKIVTTCRGDGTIVCDAWLHQHNWFQHQVILHHQTTRCLLIYHCQEEPPGPVSQRQLKAKSVKDLQLTMGL